MKAKTQQVVSILLGLATMVTMAILGRNAFPQAEIDPAVWGIFTALIVLTSAFGIPLGGGEVSIMPMIALTGALVIGIIPAAWSVICGDFLYGLARFIWPDYTGWPRDQRDLTLVGTTFANVTMHGLSVAAAGSVYHFNGGAVPALTLVQKLVMLGSATSYILTNYLTAGIFLLMRGKIHVAYLWKHIPRLMVYEVIPIIFVPLAARIFFNQGWSQFIIYAISLMIISFILRDQASSHRVLQRRVQELDSLQAVGQVLSASLDIKTIAEAVYTEVSKLMPATNFYVALYNSDTKEVSFPVVYEHNERRHWEPREMGRGLTEYVLDTRKPLLIQKDVKETVLALGLQHRGQEALSWLGVPILSGEKALGIIAVQSYPQADKIPETFDESHMEVLSTIAAQASVAIQNAKLYTQTDHALALRVQELTSILSTTHEGIVLLNQDLHVIEANRSLSKIIGTSLSKIREFSLRSPEFFTALGFRENEAQELFDKIIEEGGDIHRALVYLDLEGEKTYERVISPVLSEERELSGWLIVFRDLTEEIRLTQLREDLTRMLVHDLRSPLVTIQGGLDMIEILMEDGEKEELVEMLDISRRGSEHLMGMINELLSIHKFESGEMVLNLEPVELPELFEDVRRSFTSILKKTEIKVTTNFTPTLPKVFMDREMIRRLIYNLMDNAIKFTNDKGHIETWAFPDPDNLNMVLLGVKDDGIGIPQEIQDKLFQKYFSSGEKKSRRKGTGIGLYYSKLAVQAHGGKIWVESKPEEGSNFIIQLPIEAQKPIP
jgi:NtrC-family two-component system sensor histidine kinase KinB